MTPGTEEKTLNAALFSAKVGQLGGPVKTPFGYYVYTVLSTIPGKSETFSKVESQIKTQVATQAQQKALSDFIKNFKKKWQGKTDCRSGYVVADCKQYKAPKTTGTTSTSTSTSTTAK